MVYQITSRTNDKVKDLVKMRDDYCFFEGRRLVCDVLKRKEEVKILIVHSEKAGELDTRGVKIGETWHVSGKVLEKISSLKERPDFIAVLKPRTVDIDFRNTQVIIGLDNVQNPGNVGTVFRCASAFGVEAVAFSGASVKPTNSKFLRTAQDSYFDVHFQGFVSVDSLIKKAERAGLNIYLTSSKRSRNIVDIGDIKRPCLILFGNEGSGLREDLLFQYPTLRISQNAGIESLNIGVSAAIIMYELNRSRSI